MIIQIEMRQIICSAQERRPGAQAKSTVAYDSVQFFRTSEPGKRCGRA